MARERTQRKQAAKAAQEAAAVQRQQRNTLIRRGAVVLLVILVAVFGYRMFAKRQALKAVTTSSYPAARHVAGHIDYKESPPMGGPHNVVWQNCGVYDVPIHNEHAVHALEHGAIWITYRPDLADDQVRALRTIALDDYILVSPYPDLRSPVVASAWNRQIALENSGDPRLAAFIKEYKNNPSTTPEFGAPCAGGTSVSAREDSLTQTPGAMAPGGPGE